MIESLRCNTCIHCHVCHAVAEGTNTLYPCKDYKKNKSHGEWVYKKGKYWCSSCGDKAIYHSHFQAPLPHLTDFCPNCGAKMKGGEAE